MNLDRTVDAILNSRELPNAREIVRMNLADLVTAAVSEDRANDTRHALAKARETADNLLRASLVYAADEANERALQLERALDRDLACLSREHVERAHLYQTLMHTNGDKGRAAGLLGISPRTLYRDIKRYGWTKEAIKS